MLARRTTTTDAKMPKSISIEIKTSPSIKHENEIIRVDIRSSWMDPSILDIRNRNLPADKRQGRKLKCQATIYSLLNWGVLQTRINLAPLTMLKPRECRLYITTNTRGNLW